MQLLLVILQMKPETSDIEKCVEWMKTLFICGKENP